MSEMSASLKRRQFEMGKTFTCSKIKKKAPRKLHVFVAEDHKEVLEAIHKGIRSKVQGL